MSLAGQSNKLSVSAVLCCLIALASSGCALVSQRHSRFEGETAVTIPYKEGWFGRPVIEGSINGVRGKFLIDTGANEPVLTMRAIDECGIALSHRTKPVGFAGDDAPKKLPRVDGNVTIEIKGAGFIWRNPSVLSGLGSD